MNLKINSSQRSITKKEDYRENNHPIPLVSFNSEYIHREIEYQYNRLKEMPISSFENPDSKNEYRAINLKEPSSPKHSNEPKGVSMASSPEVKVNLDSIHKNNCIFKPNWEDIPTASTSTESLLSSSNRFCAMKNMVRSQDNINHPFIPFPNMLNPMHLMPLQIPMPLINNQKPIGHHHKRKSSSNINQVMHPNNNSKRANGQSLNRFDTTKKPVNNYFNKFNIPNEHNENTPILDLNIKIGKNYNRVFKLKKYDDLIESLHRFCEINQINQEIVIPLSNKIFLSLNKIFWLLNSKIGSYDQSYLLSIYHLWKKNISTNKRHNNSTTTTSITSSNDTKRDDKYKLKGNSVKGEDESKKSRSFGFYREIDDEDEYPELNNSF